MFLLLSSASFSAAWSKRPPFFFFPIRGTGRTDFQNGDAQQQYNSLFNRLLPLPDNCKVYPGHDYKGWTVSSIGEEKRNNPRLQITSPAEYIDLMESLDLPNPKLMDIAVSANQACGELN